MDARITKQRLSNLFSYDWLKMLVTITAFVLVLILIFTMAATKPRDEQKYAIYAQTDLTATSEFSSLGDTLRRSNAFSYDILTVGTESFAGNSYADSVYGARRAAGEGTVILMTDNITYAKNEDGSDKVDDVTGERVIESHSSLYNFAMGGARSATLQATICYDVKYYLEEMCPQYLEQFFGEDWRTSDVLDGARTPEQSFARNEGDKRYKTPEDRAQGLADERARILKLREDYLAVMAAFGEGVYSYASYEGERSDGAGGTVSYTSYLGINIGSGLNTLHKLVYYTDDAGTRTTQNVCLVVLFNNYLYGNDLNFETVSLLRYLLEHYR